ncbi:hypothetical protein RHMOL_Rhmol07G0174100 [Rhododendron molle]|uniref:Uncharacterized protein n=1 Tax=Rhododendron molle TaxID=49168 RepID=A0ACC0N1N4_RHOML|nr:hypothetical protein RHMOL_Rhmol07G0174100 [Rhododendron molle]
MPICICFHCCYDGWATGGCRVNGKNGRCGSVVGEVKRYRWGIEKKIKGVHYILRSIYITRAK